MLACKRPGLGLAPKYCDQVESMTARHFIAKDTVIQWEDLTPISIPEIRRVPSRRVSLFDPL
jgi:hypothetical protein